MCGLSCFYLELNKSENFNLKTNSKLQQCENNKITLSRTVGIGWHESVFFSHQWLDSGPPCTVVCVWFPDLMPGGLTSSICGKAWHSGENELCGETEG